MLRPIIEANNGRCFMLFSHAMMRDLAEQFRYMTLPVLLQGETVKGNCYSSLSAQVMRYWLPPAASGKAWTCAVIRCRW
jgi:hypothetical protein